MAKSAVVIGAGAIGVASAYYLQRAGFSVTVVDRGPVGHGCSYGNCCLIVPSHSDPIPGPGVILQALGYMLSRRSPFYIRPRWDPSLVAWSWKFRKYCSRAAARHGFDALMNLSRASFTLFQELTATRDADFFFQRRGLLEVFLTKRGLRDSRERLAVLDERGFTAKSLSGDEARAFEPALSDAVRGALYIEGEGHGFSYGYVRSLATTFESRGGSIRTGREVARVLVTDGRVRGVALANPDEEIAADVVVLAAGAWSGQLAAALDIAIPLQPAKGYSATVDAFPGAPALPVLVTERRVIVTPLDKRVRFGGTLELAGFYPGIDKQRYGAVVAAGREVLRTDFPMHNEEAWFGYRPVTPDGLPIIDRAPGVDGLIIATGHAMLGFTQSPATGKLVAELASGAPPSLPLDALRLDRF